MMKKKIVLGKKLNTKKLVYKEYELQDGEYLDGKEIKFIPRPRKRFNVLEMG